MNDESPKNEEQHHPSEAASPTVAPQVQHATSPTPESSGTIRMVEKASAWALILSAVLFALIAIAAIWGAFGDNDDAAWKSAASLGVVAITALVVNVGTRIYEGKVK